MTKHNGKARKAGVQVGAALANRHKQGPGGQKRAEQTRHTTDIGPGRNNQSVLERNDLEELMAMADLADRDFTAERGQVVVISAGTALDPLQAERDAAERVEAEARNAHRLKLPRRPEWTADTTPEQLDHQERTSFLSWRRELARLEEDEKLILTPFEKNLEVWRQLWRVLERSDIMVQVVDARDPLLYRSEDLESYAREIHPSKASLILLNKADLLPDFLRTLWADCLDKLGVQYAFWSAHTVTEEQQRLKTEAHALGVDPVALRKVLQQQEEGASRRRAQRGQDARIHVLDDEELLELFEQKAREAVESAGEDDPRKDEPDRRYMIGLVGYPNVGKSSTINALFGSKKTAVAPTPGKTKHFQTLNITPTLCLCDCPGLVLPKYAKSKAEMVAAGVIPIDRLTDMRHPIEVLASRVGRSQVQEVYGLRLAPPQPHQDPNAPPTAAQLLRAFAVMRGWTVGSGLPDEVRAGRQILKDYTLGRLLYCQMPPGHEPAGWAPSGDPAAAVAASRPGGQQSGAVPPVPSTSGNSSVPQLSASAAVHSTQPHATASPARPADALDAADQETASSNDSDGNEDEAGPNDQGVAMDIRLDEADRDLLQSMADAEAGLKQKRPEYKLNKKAARTKGNRGQGKEVGYDGAAMVTGKKGGLVRVTGY